MATAAGTAYQLDFGRGGSQITADGGCRIEQVEAHLDAAVLVVDRDEGATTEPCSAPLLAQSARLATLLRSRPVLSGSGLQLTLRGAGIEITFTGPLPRPVPVGDPLDVGLRGRRLTATAATVDGTLRPVALAAYRLTVDETGGRLSWSGGCNQSEGPVVVATGRLELADDARSTAVFCPDARMEQDGLLDDLVRGHPTLAVEGASVTLASATTQIRFEPA